MASSFRIRMDINKIEIGKFLKNSCDEHFLSIMKSRKDELNKEQLIKMYGGNRAMLICKIDDESHQFYAHSSVSEDNHPFKDEYLIKIKKRFRKLKHIDVDRYKNINIVGWRRDSDSEAKLLQKIAEMYTIGSKGYIYMYTQYSPCLSCDYHIVQFIEKFPDIELHVFYDYDYPHEQQKRYEKK